MVQEGVESRKRRGWGSTGSWGWEAALPVKFPGAELRIKILSSNLAFSISFLQVTKMQCAEVGGWRGVGLWDVIL